MKTPLTSYFCCNLIIKLFAVCYETEGTVLLIVYVSFVLHSVAFTLKHSVISDTIVISTK